MNRSLAKRACVILLAAALGACATGSDVKQSEGSGFLRDYSSLQETKDTLGKTIRFWVSPKLTPANYNAVLVEPLVYYPEPRPTEQVSAESLRQIITYTNESFQRAIGQRFRVVDRAGPGVLEIRAAISAVAAQGAGLRPYQYVPIAFVATMASNAATGAPQQAFIVFEIEATDSVTGELLAMRVRVGTGERLARVGGQPVITLDTVKPLVDEFAGIAFPELATHVKPK
jgi:Protein of unknown function (DUF3313)